MKIIFIIFANLLIAKTLFSKNNVIICGTFKNIQGNHLKIFEPVNGYFNMSLISKDDTLNHLQILKDSFYFTNYIISPSTFTVYITTKDNIYLAKTILLVVPNDSIHLSIDLDKTNSDVISYSGSNAAGHQLFNDLNYNPITKFKEVINAMNSLASHKTTFISDVDIYIKNITSGFDKLLAEKQISSTINEYYNVTIRQLLYQFVTFKFLQNYKQRNILTKEERDSIVNYFYSRQPVNGPYAISAYNSYFYILEYYNFLTYKKFNLQSIEPLNSDKEFYFKGEKYNISNECGQFLYIENKEVKEDLWAIFMLDIMKMAPVGRFEENIKQFKEIFPTSRWIPFLNKQLLDINGKEIITYELQFPINYLKPIGEIKTLKDLFEILPSGKAVFIDLWASWCGPCLNTFRYNKQLDPFLLKNNIIRLYLSLDTPNDESKWVNTINQYALGGYHMLTNKSLLTDIKKKGYNISEDGEIAIPRYMLVSKNHILVLNDAMTPANITVLKEQINNFILKDSN